MVCPCMTPSYHMTITPSHDLEGSASSASTSNTSHQPRMTSTWEAGRCVQARSAYPKRKKMLATVAHSNVSLP